MASLFLYNNLVQHYDPSVISFCGTPIRIRLRIVYDALIYYHHLFKLDKVHCK